MSDVRGQSLESTPLELAILAGEIDAQLMAPGVATPTVSDAARVLGVSEGHIIKSLVFIDDQGQIVLAVAPGPTRVNRDRLARVCGRGKLVLAPPDVVLARVGYPVGGTPPVWHVEPVPVVVDCRVSDMDVVYGGGGRIDLLLRISPKEIVRLTGARVADIVD